MSLKPSPIGPVPEETARVAKAAFRRGDPLLKLRDELGTVFADADFADLSPSQGQPRGPCTHHILPPVGSGQPAETLSRPPVPARPSHQPEGTPA